MNIFKIINNSYMYTKHIILTTKLPYILPHLNHSLYLFYATQMLNLNISQNDEPQVDQNHRYQKSLFEPLLKHSMKDATASANEADSAVTSNAASRCLFHWTRKIVSKLIEALLKKNDNRTSSMPSTVRSVDKCKYACVSMDRNCGKLCLAKANTNEYVNRFMA